MLCCEDVLESLAKRNTISIKDFSKEELLNIISYGCEFLQNKPTDLLKGLLLTCCFFEPSTRTRLSFEAAMLRLGGSVMGFTDGDSTSIKKGESLSDTMRIIGSYSDAIVIRHPFEGAARLAAESAQVPVINAGDGANAHPTQTLVDLMTILLAFGTIDGLKIALMGDLKHGRAVHSFVDALNFFKVRLYFISPPSLELPKSFCEELKKKGVLFSFHQDIDEVIETVDVMYMTRLQKERLENQSHHEFQSLDLDILKRAKNHLKILHPLPRTSELPIEIDDTPHACYFEQAANGIALRQALLSLCFGRLI